MKFHDIASFLFFRRRGAIPTEALSVSPAQHRYLEQERRIRRQIFACRVLFLILFLVSWEVSARIGILNDFIFSSPSRVLSCFLSMAADRTIFYHTGITILETMLSFFLVTCIGIFGAVALWSSRRLAKILEPYLVMLNSLPKSALAPVLIVWLGNNMKTIITAAVSAIDLTDRWNRCSSQRNTDMGVKPELCGEHPPRRRNPDPCSQQRLC